MPTYYELLGIPVDATPPEIKRAYRQLARQYHPDSGNTTDSVQFVAITEAYQTLIDENLRAVYDRQLKVQQAQAAYDRARDMVAQRSTQRERHELRPFYWMLIGFVIFFFIMLIALAIIMIEYGPERVRMQNEPNSVNWIIESEDDSNFYRYKFGT